MNEASINIVFLISYDYAFIKTSLPLVYKSADEIVISVDINRITWAGNKYSFDESILDWIKIQDTDKKIKIYQENFYVAENTAMQNETRQRQLSANQFAKPGWVVQLDVDEYFLNFNSFITKLKTLNRYLLKPAQNNVDIAVNWMNLFKRNEEGYFVVSKPLQPIRIATNFPQYDVARSTNSFTIFTPFIMVHDTWARSEEEILTKVNNWGHKDDFDTAVFFKKWKNLTIENYKEYKNFNPVKPYSALGELVYVRASSIDELIKNISIPKSATIKLVIKNLKQKVLKRWQ
jgi:hypothetical protein